MHACPTARRSARIALVALAPFAALGLPAGAQCTPSWDTTLGNPGISGGYVGPMTVWDDGNGPDLYIGGSATGIGGSAANKYLVRYDPSTGAFSRLGSGIQEGTTNAFMTRMRPWDDGTGEKLYVAGQFFSAGGVSGTNSFAAWNGTSWESLGAGFDQTVPRVIYDMLPLDLGAGEKLYLAGNFADIGEITGNGLATFDGDTYGQWGNGIGLPQGVNAFIAALADWDDGSGRAIYACGRFTSIDGVNATNVARYDVASGAWEPFGQRLVPDSSFNNMTSWAVFDDGNGPALYVGGQQFRIGGTGQKFNVAKWDGANWTGVGAGQTISGRVQELAVFDDGSGPALYMAGTATYEVNYFAKLVEGRWVPVLDGGVNNPSIDGGFASAFGLLVWDNKLIVGGNFSKVGGFDPVSGAGTGTPLNAKGLAVVQGCEPPACIADYNGTPDAGDILDLLDFIADFSACEISPAPCGSFGNADINGDTFVDILDFLDFIEAFSQGC